MMMNNGYHTGLCDATQIHPPHISSPTWFFYDSLSQFSILNGVYQIDFQFQKRFSFSSLLFHKIIFNSKKEKDFQFSFSILLFTHGLAACYNNITERGKVIVSIPIFFLLLEISNINYLTAISNRCYNTVVRPKERKAIWLL